MKDAARVFGRESFRNYNEAVRREWVITNGNGSYADSSIIGANTRKHHGLLIASMHAPTDRKVLVNRILEAVDRNGLEIHFSSGKKKNGLEEAGFLRQTSFSLNGSVPEFSYYADGFSMKKSIAYEWEKNTVAVRYILSNLGDDAVFLLSPVYNYRDHNEGSAKKDLRFEIVKSSEKGLFLIIPKANKNLAIKTYVSCGAAVLNPKEESFDADIRLKTEADTGMSDKDAGFVPLKFEIPVRKGEKKEISVIFSIEEEFEKNASKTIKQTHKRDAEIIKQAGVTDDFSKAFVLAADKFVVNRASTGGKTILAGLPWFTDWGRDTMISFTGLTLCTGRFDDARSILKTFVQYEKNGLLPNMFPDLDCDPIYNTVDAALWFFFCVYKFVEYTKDHGFVQDELYPCMKKILEAYQKGTDFSIGMDKDFLIYAGSGSDQVTWMDVCVDGKCMTPRHGKPVEINALWYNALCITSEFAKIFGDKDYSLELSELATKVKANFEKRFWNEERNCLYDVVDEVLDDGTIRDNAQLRPNQIYAVSLPFAVLSPDKEKSIDDAADVNKEKCVVDAVYKELYTDFGLRTLSTDDPDYRGIYKGTLPERDAAYHQGTAWAFLMGGFITAFLKVYPNSKDIAEEMLRPLKQHLNDGGIGGIAEVFDGDAPHISGGCYSQAWSVAEILRAVREGDLMV